MVTKKATTKKSSVKKSVKAASKRVQSGARTKSVEREQARPEVNGETRVVCPVCGSEFDVLSEHEHQVKNATVLGVDSGLGTIVLPVSKRGEALKAAGIDTSKYFSIQIPGGGEQMMKKTDDGRAVPVAADDPVIQAIISQGTVPNRSLFRRWIMSQIFHALTSRGGFAQWLRWHGYRYQWEMFIEELHVQAKLYGKDMENFIARNRWFNKGLAVAMAQDYIEQLRKDANSRPQHKCKGVPYVRVEHVNYFVSDIEKKLIAPLWIYVRAIETAKTPQVLEERVKAFWYHAPVKSWHYDQCKEWKDAYRGMGAYAVMQNLLRFHGCTFPKGNDFYEREKLSWTGLDMLELAAKTYADGEGWRLFGLMKQMLEENHIDIEAKMKQWAAAKEARRA